jgi:hypothetical protein
MIDDDDNPRPIRVRVEITGRDAKVTAYAMRAAYAEEERTKVHGHPLDIRFTFSDVEYDA